MFAGWQIIDRNCFVYSLLQIELNESQGHGENIQICSLHGLLKRWGKKMYVDFA